MERHTEIIDKILSEEEKDFSGRSQVIEFRKNDKFFLGFLAGKSIYLPLSANQETIAEIKNMATLNRAEARGDSQLTLPQRVSNSLSLPLNGSFDGYRCDASTIDNQTILVLHIYPDGNCESQQIFKEGVSDSLQKRGVILTCPED